MPNRPSHRCRQSVPRYTGSRGGTVKKKAPKTQKQPYYQPPKPLWHFGWAGWVFALCAILLMLLAFSEYNPIYEMQSAIMDRWGVPVMYDITVYWMVYPWLIIKGIIPSPYVLMWLLLAFGVYPHRVPRLWCYYLVLLCLAAPLFNAQLTLHNWFDFALIVQMVGFDEWIALEAIQLLLLAGGLWMFTRSWRVFAVIAGATVLFRVPWEFIWSRNIITVFWLWPWSVTAWHITCATTLFMWALRQRRLAGRWWTCRVCGYDLRGCPADLCPECGTTRVSLRAPSASSG